MTESADEYKNAYLSDYGFESIMVSYRRRFLLERLQQLSPGCVLEIGCGPELLYQSFCIEGGSVDRWVIIEPVRQFAQDALASGLPRLNVIQGYLENETDSTIKLIPNKPDLIICSSVLHEVPSSAKLMESILPLMGAHTRLHVNVPNSQSMHRGLAIAMNLIVNSKELSYRNLELMQHRVYDIESLKEEVSSFGLEITGQGGYLFKPFTHAQMEEIMPVLGQAVMNGLFEFGKQHPELASEIWIEAVLGVNE